ncbi:MAG: hypothetical protein EBT86_00620 [Actinobacteria bacterium]|nr:hypothetical protein [Actinomycetota bacterium]
MSIDYKIFKMFDYLILRGTIQKGNFYNWNSAQNGDCTFYVVGGKVDLTDEITKDSTISLKAGDFHPAYSWTGLFTGDVIEDFEVWSWHPIHNNDIVIAPFDVITMSEHDTHTILLGTNIFICKGIVSIGGQDFVGPTKVSFKSGDKVITAKENSYILKFK